MSGMRRLSRLAVGIGVVSLLMAGCGGGSDGGGEKKSTEPTKMTIAASLLDSAPFMAILQVAADKGWFEEEGIDAKIVTAVGGGDSMRLVTSGNADLAITGPDAVYKAVKNSNGALTNIGPWMNYTGVRWVAKDDSVPLKNASLGVTSAGSTGETFAKAIQAAHPEWNLKLVVAGGTGAQWAAAKSGRISAAYAPSSSSYPLVDEGGHVLLDGREILGDIPKDLVAISSDYAKDNPEAVKAFWKVADRAYTYIREDTAAAVSDTNALIKMDEQLLMKATQDELTSPNAYKIEVNCEVMANLTKVMVASGQVSGPPDWSKEMDQQYLPEKARCDSFG